MLSEAENFDQYLDLLTTQYLPGLMAFGETAFRGMAGMGLGLRDASLNMETSTAGVYDSMMNRAAEMMQGMDMSPSRQQQMEYFGKDLRSNTEKILPAGVIDAYLQGLEPAAAATENKLNQWGFPGVAREAGATIRLGEFVMP